MVVVNFAEDGEMLMVVVGLEVRAQPRSGDRHVPLCPHAQEPAIHPPNPIFTHSRAHCPAISTRLL